MNRYKRISIYNKYDGRCGYCGIDITYEEMQIDHMIPRLHYEIMMKEADEYDNLMSSCSVCNHYKRALDVDMFRERLLTLHKRISKIPKMPRTKRGVRYKIYMENILRRYNITEDKPFDGVFYYEKQKR